MNHDSENADFRRRVLKSQQAYQRVLFWNFEKGKIKGKTKRRLSKWLNVYNAATRKAMR